jgi:acylphosphatase
MQIARRYLVSGRVQGVGFRYFVQESASRERLRGWVRNLPGGHVEAFAMGEADGVERFEQDLRRGPASARVDRLDVVNVSDAELSSLDPSSSAAGVSGFAIR